MTDRCPTCGRPPDPAVAALVEAVERLLDALDELTVRANRKYTRIAHDGPLFRELRDALARVQAGREGQSG